MQQLLLQLKCDGEGCNALSPAFDRARFRKAQITTELRRRGWAFVNLCRPGQRKRDLCPACVAAAREERKAA